MCRVFEFLNCSDSVKFFCGLDSQLVTAEATDLLLALTVWKVAYNTIYCMSMIYRFVCGQIDEEFAYLWYFEHAFQKTNFDLKLKLSNWVVDLNSFSQKITMGLSLFWCWLTNSSATVFCRVAWILCLAILSQIMSTIIGKLNKLFSFVVRLAGKPPK